MFSAIFPPISASSILTPMDRFHIHLNTALNSHLAILRTVLILRPPPCRPTRCQATRPCAASPSRAYRHPPCRRWPRRGRTRRQLRISSRAWTPPPSWRATPCRRRLSASTRPQTRLSGAAGRPRRSRTPTCGGVGRVFEAQEPHIPRGPLHGALHRPRVGLLDASSRREVRVVDHDVGVRDVPLVVVVVDDRYLVVAEVLLRPRSCESAQARKLDAVLRVRREAIVLPRPRAVPVPGGVVPEGSAR